MPIHSNVPTCIHVKIDGIQCGSPRLKSAPYCFFHNRMRRINPSYELPLIEDAKALQMAIMEVLRGIYDGSLELKRANSILYGLQIAQCNLKRMQNQPFNLDEVVLEDPVETVFEERLQAFKQVPAKVGEVQAMIKQAARGQLPEGFANASDSPFSEAVQAELDAQRRHVESQRGQSALDH